MSKHNRERRVAKAFAKGKQAKGIIQRKNPYRKYVYFEAWMRGLLS